MENGAEPATLGAVIGAVQGAARLGAAATGDTFRDPENARTIHIVATLLVLIAVAMAVWTVWWWRRIRAEHPALGPLEVMGTERWRRAEPGLRRVRLDAVRPVDEFDGDLDAYDGREAAEAAHVPLPPPIAPMDPLLRPQRAE